MIFGGELSLSVLDTTEMVNRAIKIHKLTPTTAAALGRAMTAATFMSGDLKNKGDKLYVVVAGDGAGGKITVCGNGNLYMRGEIENPFADLPLKENGKLDVGGCVGKNGRITVVKSMGLKEPYSGSVPLVSGELAEDFAAYYAYSEQRPTAMALGVKIGKNMTCIGAGGVMVTAMPFAKEENLVKAEEIVKSLSNVSTVISECGAEGLIKKYFGVENAENYDVYYPKYKCLCNRKSIEKVIVSLGETEAFDIIEKEGAIKVDCRLCGKTYTFGKEDAERLFKRGK